MTTDTALELLSAVEAAAIVGLLIVVSYVVLLLDQRRTGR